MWRCLAVMLGVPSLRIFTPLLSEMSGVGAPWALLSAFILFVPILLIYGHLAKKFPGKSFSQMNRELFGKVVGNILSSLYVLWSLFLAAFYLGEYATRISGTIFYNTSMVLFSVLLLFAVSYALKKGAGAIARTGSILAYFVIGGIVLFGIVLSRDIDVNNFLPFSSENILPTLSGILPVFSVSVFFPLFFVFGKRTTLGKPFFPRALWCLVAAAAVSFILVAVPLGVFGEEMLSKMMVPFFAVTRNVILFNSLERLEAVLVSVILMSDFIVVALLCAGSIQVLGEIFETNNKSKLVDAITVGLFLGGMLLTVGDFQIDDLVQKLVVPGNLIFGLSIPILWGIFGKLRKLS